MSSLSLLSAIATLAQNNQTQEAKQSQQTLNTNAPIKSFKRFADTPIANFGYITAKELLIRIRNCGALQKEDSPKPSSITILSYVSYIFGDGFTVVGEDWFQRDTYEDWIICKQLEKGLPEQIYLVMSTFMCINDYDLTDNLVKAIKNCFSEKNHRVHKLYNPV